MKNDGLAILQNCNIASLVISESGQTHESILCIIRIVLLVEP